MAETTHKTWRHSCLRQLTEIGNLPEGWNGCDVPQFTEALIEKCKKIVMILEYEPEIFPTGDNGIQMEFGRDDESYLEFDIYEDKTEELFIPRRQYKKAVEKKVEENEYDAIRDEVNRFYKQE